MNLSRSKGSNTSLRLSVSYGSKISKIIDKFKANKKIILFNIPNHKGVIARK